jgi:hypothetical protein
MYKGVLTGCDQSHEWMLKWWWNHYAKHNTYPVTFIDFGMSLSARKWCENHGTLIEVPTPHLTLPENRHWGKFLPKEERKNVWFYKPLAMLKAPYTINIWMDVDCKVKQNLEPFFNYPFKECAFGLDTPSSAHAEKEGNLIPPEAHTFNAGVVLYEKSNTLIQRWAEKTLLECTKSYGDQDVLNRFLFEEKIPVTHLPKKFNLLYPYKDNDEAMIYHYATSAGKLLIIEEMTYGS